MKFWGNIALAVFSVFGFIAWIYNLTTGRVPLDFPSAFFTVGSAVGILLFTSNAMEARK
jgi:hypothetical protein